MNYCRIYLIPDAKPSLSLQRGGVCRACHAHEKKTGYLGTTDGMTGKQDSRHILGVDI